VWQDDEDAQENAADDEDDDEQRWKTQEASTDMLCASTAKCRSSPVFPACAKAS